MQNLERHRLALERHGISLKSRLGRGSAGEVFLCFDDAVGKETAVKAVAPPLEREAYLDRVKHEFEIVASLDHPGVVKIHRLIPGEGSWYLEMEFVRGETLESFSKRVRFESGTTGIFVDILTRVLDSLQYIHGRNVLHGDLKPSNILLGAVSQRKNGDGYNGSVKIADFGLARSFDPGTGAALEGSITGTAAYMPPEVVKGARLTTRSDLYSFGIVLYEALSGRVPFTGEHPVPVMLKHLNDIPPRPSLLNSFISPEFESFILRFLEKNPDRRFDTAGRAATSLRGISSAPPAEVTGKKRPVIEAEPTLPALPFEGRGRELAGMEERLERVKSGEGGLSLLSGSEGMGKTRFLLELKRKATELRFDIFDAIVRDRHTLPLMPFLELAGKMLRRHPGGRLAEVAETAGLDKLTARQSKYADLFAGMDEWAEARAALFETLEVLLRILSERAPVLLIVENIEFADSATLDLLLHIAGELPSRRILICCTMDPGGHMDEKFLERLSIEEAFEEMKLEPLEKKQVKRIISRALENPRLPENFYSDAFRQSAGNPRLLREVLESFIDEGSLVFGDGGWEAARADGAEPAAEPDPERFVRARLAKLSSRERELLEICALLGRTIEKSDLVDIVSARNRGDAGAGDSGTRETPSTAAKNASATDWIDSRLDRFVALHYLGRAPFSDGGVFHFIHESARNFVERNIEHERREKLHTVIASTLEKKHAGETARPVERLARHWRLSSEKERAVEHLEKGAARALEVFNVDRAIEYQTYALEILEQGDCGEKTADLRLARGMAFEKRCNYAKAVDDYRASAEMAIDRELTGKAGTALLFEGLILYNTGEYRKALGRFEKALNLGEKIGYRELISSAYNNEGLAHWRLGENERAIECFEKSLSICKITGRESMEGVAHYNIGNIHLDMGRFADAEQSYLAALDIHRKTGQKEHEATVLGNLGILAFERGDPEESERNYTKSLTLMLEAGNRGKEAISRKNIGELVCLKGEYDRAKSLFDKTIEIARFLGNNLLEAQGFVGAGIALRETGDYEKSLTALETALEKSRVIESRDTETQALCELATLYARTGAPGEAARFADAAEALVESCGFSMMRAKICQVRSEISYADGDAAGAVRLAVKEVEEAELLGRAVAGLEARARLAFYLLASGDPAGAAEEAAKVAGQPWAGSKSLAAYVAGATGRGEKAEKALAAAAASETCELRWMSLAELASRKERPEVKHRLLLEAWENVKKLHDKALEVVSGTGYMKTSCRKKLFGAALYSARTACDTAASAQLEADKARFDNSPVERA